MTGSSASDNHVPLITAGGAGVFVIAAVLLAMSLFTAQPAANT